MNVDLSNETGEEFVEVWTHKKGKDCLSAMDSSAFYHEWMEKASAKHSSPELFGADALRQLYPGHSLVMSMDFRLNVLRLPGVHAIPLNESELVTNLFFVPLARRLGTSRGVLIDTIEFGSFRLIWGEKEFILCIAQWPVFIGKATQQFLLHKGPEGPARELLLYAGMWGNDLHAEIWVYDMGMWRKDHGLWTEVQKADWKDIILKQAFKEKLQKDVYGFFASEAIYKELAIPWKRGLILLGPPGNGKTITIKVIMKTCDEAGFSPLYVKSFQNFRGDEAGISDVFIKAREMSPCVVILEDLDSLITDRNRSFFLNQLDGLEGNDGLLVIGTTNHFEKLDPGLSARPSRFDRKYLFDDPDRNERGLYAKYWQDKLKNNREISFPDTLVDDVADRTNHFSFAYLKEAFVSSLVILAGIETDKPSFASVLFDQIKVLRKELEKSPEAGVHRSVSMKPAEPAGGRDIRVPLDALSDSIAKSHSFPSRAATSNLTQSNVGSGRDVRVLLDALSDAIAKSEAYPQTPRIFDIHSPSPPTSSADEDGPDFRMLLERMSANPQKGQDLTSLTTRIFTNSVRLPRVPDYVGERPQDSRVHSGSIGTNDGVSGRIYGDFESVQSQCSAPSNRENVEATLLRKLEDMSYKKKSMA